MFPLAIERDKIGARSEARVAELADAPDLGSGVERRAGSSPVPGTSSTQGAVNLDRESLLLRADRIHSFRLD